MSDGKKPTQILVTGGGGFLGSAIVRQLVQRGDRVRSFSRSRYPELDAMGVEQVCGDLTRPEDVENACRGMDVVFHTAARAGVWGLWQDFYRPNVIGTENILHACLKHKVSRLIYTSSPSVVFDRSNMEGVDESVPYPSEYHAHYPHTKAIAERKVLQAARNGLKTIILRPHLIWGPGDPHLAPRIIARADRLARVGAGRNRVDTIYIDNAADAHIQAADRLKTRPDLSGRIYFISQDDPVPLWDMIDAILNAGGKPPVTRSIPHRAAWCIGALMELAYTAFRIQGEPPMTRFVADELATSHWFDISAAKKDLDYTPEISIREGLHRLETDLK